MRSNSTLNQWRSGYQVRPDIRKIGGGGGGGGGGGLLSASGPIRKVGPSFGTQQIHCMLSSIIIVLGSVYTACAGSKSIFDFIDA